MTLVQGVAEGVVRLQVLAPGEQLVRRSYAVEHDPSPQPATLHRGTTDAALKTAELTVAVALPSGAITVRTPGGEVLVSESGSGFEPVDQGFRWTLRLPRSESCHGLGLRGFPLSLRTRRLALWNHDARSYRPGADPLYLSVPFYLGHRPSVSYGLFWDNPARGTVDLDSKDREQLVYECVRLPLTAYVITGTGPAQVVQRFAALTGSMPLPPLWSLGYHQSRWSYADEAQVRRVATRMRAERIPCDAIHFDIDYMNGYRVFTWNHHRFPKPAKLLSDLKTDGFESVAILDPGIKDDPDYVAFAQGLQRDLFLTTPSGKPLRREAWAGPSAFPDFTDPACRAWWSQSAADFAAAGVAGFWTDMNEPSTFNKSATLPDDTPHDWDGEGNTHVAGGHAVYGMQMARATRDGLAQLRAQRRPFVISRAGYAGLQRYAATWSGDSRSTWDHLRITIPQLLNVGLSGIPFAGSDAGGFRGDPDSELYLRWMQLASMTPFFRTHSARTSRERNPWSYGAATTDRIRDVIELRYRLLPYLYTAVQQASSHGLPIMRPMFFEQPESADYPLIDDQFMLGDHLLVAPILQEGARSRRVLLPPGGWYRLGQQVAVSGDRTITANAGLGLPIFVRAGAVVPMWPVQQSTSHPDDRLTLCSYAGKGRSTLYEDAGDGFGYREDEQLLTTFSMRTPGGRLELTCEATGSYAARQSVSLQLFGTAGASLGDVDGRQVEIVDIDGVPTMHTGRFLTVQV